MREHKPGPNPQALEDLKSQTPIKTFHPLGVPEQRSCEKTLSPETPKKSMMSGLGFRDFLCAPEPKAESPNFPQLKQDAVFFFSAKAPKPYPDPYTLNPKLP